ncbi:MAG: nodulation protein NfeD [Deltaproteobacteria bacterium]|nr:nodulation protein NfeD [Deltaproteobacteria bacterium]
MPAIFRAIFIFLASCFLLPASAGATPQIIHYTLDDTIHGGTVEILERIFDKAKKENAEAILIQMDTPGGLLDATEEIVKLFLNSQNPVIVYVAPSGAKAGSAGTFITLAAHIAAMAPGTYIGAAHPVEMFGGGEENEQQKIMKKKIESATTSFIEAIAEQRGRNVEWARKAVLESETLTQDKALKNRVIDIVAPSKEELLKVLHGRKVKLPDGEKTLNTQNAVLVPYEPGLKLRFLNTVASPTMIYLLILAMIAGIYLEISHPGSILPGAAAGACLVLLLIATRTLPVNALGILLMGTALVLLIVEIYVVSYGLLTVGAIACFFIGSLFLFDPVETDVQVPLPFIIGSTGALAAIAGVIGYSVVRTLGRKQASGRESMIGARGTVEESVGPEGPGKIFVQGEYWNAVSDVPIEKGASVEIVEMRGLSVVVKKSG